jgi:hypothetical protein
MDQYKGQEGDVRYSHLSNGDDDGVSMGTFDLEKDLHDRRMLVYPPKKSGFFCSKKVLGLICLALFLIIFCSLIAYGISNKSTRKVLLKFLPKSESEAFLNRSCIPFPNERHTAGSIHYSHSLENGEIPHFGAANLVCPSNMDIVNGAQHTLCISGEWATFLGTCQHLGGTWLRLVDKEGSACYSSSKSCRSMGIRAGRPEINHNGVWGTFCHGGLGLGPGRHWHKVAIGETFCKQLGLNPQGAKVCGEACEGEAEQKVPIHFNNLDCPQGKGDISHCSYDTRDLSVCTHANDVGLICGEDKPMESCVDSKKNCAHMSSNACMAKSGYNGNKDTTRSGKECQRWMDTDPHNSTFRLWHHNYCRNPDMQMGPWCYTMDRQKRWEYCFDDCDGAWLNDNDDKDFGTGGGGEATFEIVEDEGKDGEKDERPSESKDPEAGEDEDPVWDPRDPTTDNEDEDNDDEDPIWDPRDPTTDEDEDEDEEKKDVHAILPPRTRNLHKICEALQKKYNDIEVEQNSNHCIIYNKHIYWRIDQKLEWEAGRDECQRIRGGDLMSIANQREQNLALHLVNMPVRTHGDQPWAHFAWIGIHLKGCSNNPQWTDGTPFEFNAFWRGEPNCDNHYPSSWHINGGKCTPTAKEECVHINGKQYHHWIPGWNDIACCLQFMSLCKAPLP